MQLHGQARLGKCDEGKLLGFVKSVAVLGVHKEVHRVSFQSMQQPSGEMYSSYVVSLKATTDFCQFTIEVPNCEVDKFQYAHHTDKRQLSYRDEMVGTQLVAGTGNNEHRSKVLAESETLKALEGKLECPCTLEKSESTSAKLSQSVLEMKVMVSPEGAGVCRSCKTVHKKCGKYKRRHPCAMVCYNCNKRGHRSVCCPAPKSKMKDAFKEASEKVTEAARPEVATFSMQVQYVKSIIKRHDKIKRGISNTKEKIDAVRVGQAKRGEKRKKQGFPTPLM